MPNYSNHQQNDTHRSINYYQSS